MESVSGRVHYNHINSFEYQSNDRYNLRLLLVLIQFFMDDVIRMIKKNK